MSIIRHSYNDAIISQDADGYVCLTDMAKASGKATHDYLRLDSTKAYLEGLSDETGFPVSSLIRTIKGKGKNQGTWAHPEIAIDFAQWCNVPFRIWANRTLRNVITQPQPEPKRAIHYYSDRVMDFDKNLVVPKGHWCVIQECSHLLLKVERMGYPVEKFDLLDGSIGKRYSIYRKTQSWYTPPESAQYLHNDVYVRINAYPYREICTFKEWAIDVYEPLYFNQYLETKYGQLVC